MKAIGKRNLSKLRNYMGKNSIDLILFKDEVNTRYFSAFFGSCILSISKSDRILFVPPLEFDRTIEQADVEEVVNIKDFENSYGRAISKKFKSCKKVGLAKSSFPLGFYEDLKKRLRFLSVDIENFLTELRAVKFREEIKLIKESAKISNSGIKIVEEALNEIKKGRRIKEKELALRIEEELKRKRGESLAFDTLVATGKRSSFPHPYPFASSNVIREGLGIVDFGSVYRGYCSDITVPFVLGRINERQRKIIETVEEAYKLAIDSIKIDVPTWKLYEKVDDFLRTKGFELKHGLGHGLGLTVHDYPSISAKPRDKIQLKDWKEIKFKENMVFAIEPGIYSKQGLRLENDFLLTRKGLKTLTKAGIIYI